MRRYPGMTACSSHTCFGCSCPLRVMVTVCLNSSVLYQVLTYRLCIAATSASPLVMEREAAEPLDPVVALLRAQAVARTSPVRAQAAKRAAFLVVMAVL